MGEVYAIVLPHNRCQGASLKVRLYLFVANKQCCTRDHGSSHTIAAYNMSDGLKDLKPCLGENAAAVGGGDGDAFAQLGKDLIEVE